MPLHYCKLYSTDSEHRFCIRSYNAYSCLKFAMSRNTDNPPGWQKKKFIFQLSQKNKLLIFACRKLILMWRRRRDRRLIYCVKYARITVSSNPYFSVYRQNQQFCPHTGKYGSEETRTLAYLDSDNLARQILKLQYQL